MHTPKKKSGRLNMNQRAMIEALKKSLGIVATAARMAGVARKQHYVWLEKSEAYREAYEDINNEAIDFAETSLLNQIKSGNTTATIFYLKTKGKERGYIERVEMGGIGGGAMKIEVEQVLPKTILGGGGYVAEDGVEIDAQTESEYWQARNNE